MNLKKLLEAILKIKQPLAYGEKVYFKKYYMLDIAPIKQKYSFVTLCAIARESKLNIISCKQIEQMWSFNKNKK